MDPAARIRADLAELAQEDRDGWNADSLSARLVELLELRERLDAEIVRVAAPGRRRRASEARQLAKLTPVLDEAPLLGRALHAGDTMGPTSPRSPA